MAGEFDVTKFVQEFEGNPSLDKIDQLKKPELLAVAQHYETSVKTSMRKIEIKRLLVQDLVDEEFCLKKFYKVYQNTHLHPVNWN